MDVSALPFVVLSDVEIDGISRRRARRNRGDPRIEDHALLRLHDSCRSGALVSLATNSLAISAPRRRLAAFSSSPLALQAASSSASRCIHLGTNLGTEFLTRHTCDTEHRAVAPFPLTRRSRLGGSLNLFPHFPANRRNEPAVFADRFIFRS